jgi:hypothetical protein
MSTNKTTNLNPIELTSAELDGIVGGSYQFGNNSVSSNAGNVGKTGEMSNSIASMQQAIAAINNAQRHASNTSKNVGGSIKGAM